jgi:hypothetical protein
MSGPVGQDIFNPKAICCKNASGGANGYVNECHIRPGGRG